MSVKRGLMTQFPFARGRAFVCKNIGDYIQAVATRQFVPYVNEYIEQEEADKYYPKDNTPIKLVMNGWFQWRSENWPPSEFIEPLLISMHISPLKAKDLLSLAGINFLKKYSPVGCRDIYTKQLLESHGIPSYFSACMTLTLGEKYKVPPQDKHGVCIVDPFFEIPDIISERKNKKAFNIKNFFSGLWLITKHFSVVLKLGKNPFFRQYSPKGFLDRSNSKLRPYYKAALFYEVYSKKFDKKLLLKADYVTHWIDVDMRSNIDNDYLLNIAEDLVKKYSRSRIVITSRIHAGLPCLGVETPIIFITHEEVLSEEGNFNTPGRLGGLIDFFRTLNLSKGKFSTDDPVLNTFGIIGENTNFSNKDDWRTYAIDLKKKVIDFMR